MVDLLWMVDLLRMVDLWMIDLLGWLLLSSFLALFLVEGPAQSSCLVVQAVEAIFPQPSHRIHVSSTARPVANKT